MTTSSGLAVLLALLVIGAVVAQQRGTWTPEVHPSVSVRACKGRSGTHQLSNSSVSNSFGQITSDCVVEESSVVLDANRRWVHQVNDYTSCYAENKWNQQLCADPSACAKNCALEGVDYAKDFGVNAQPDAASVSLKLKTNSNIGSRLFVLDKKTDNYKLFKLKNREFAFEVDTSELPCGLNGALYFVEMPEDGGSSKFPSNKAGAAYGTGYCDSKCTRDNKFVYGEANTLNKQGSCCTEVNVWDANTMATSFAAHSCDGSANCDREGCDFNPFRLGSQFFYGPGLGYHLDSTKPFTVVTQFLTANHNDESPLVEIKRFYIQNGKIIDNPSAPYLSGSYNSLSDDFCAAEAKAFGETSAKQERLASIGAALDRGLVLTLSLSVDDKENMLWLDGDYPANGDISQPGVSRGTCPNTSGRPSDVEEQFADASVKYMNIRYGAIGSTFSSSV
jgi:cellulose 1,4-beta-cellobiosidase